jgi:hypothetical protein
VRCRLSSWSSQKPPPPPWSSLTSITTAAVLISSSRSCPPYPRGSSTPYGFIQHAGALGFGPWPLETHVNGKHGCAALFVFGHSPSPSPSLLHLPRVSTYAKSPLSLSLPRTTQWTIKSTRKPVANTRASASLQPLDSLHPNEEQEEIGRLTN